MDTHRMVNSRYLRPRKEIRARAKAAVIDTSRQSPTVTVATSTEFSRLRAMPLSTRAPM